MDFHSKYLKYKNKYLQLKQLKELHEKKGGDINSILALAAVSLLVAKRYLSCPSKEEDKNKIREDIKRWINDDKIINSDALKDVIAKLREDYNKNKKQILDDVNSGKQHLSSNIKIFEFKDALQKFQTATWKRIISKAVDATGITNAREETSFNVDKIIGSIDCVCNPSYFKTFNLFAQAGNSVTNSLKKSIYLSHVSHEKTLVSYLVNLLNLANKAMDPNKKTFNSVLLYEHGKIVSKILANLINLDKYKIEEDIIHPNIGDPILEQHGGDGEDNINTQDGGNLYTQFGIYIFFYNSSTLNQEKSKPKHTMIKYWALPFNPSDEFHADYNLTSNKLDTHGNSRMLSLDSITDQLGTDSWYYYFDGKDNALFQNVSKLSSLFTFSPAKKQFDNQNGDFDIIKNEILTEINPELAGQYIYINCFLDLIPEYKKDMEVNKTK